MMSAVPRYVVKNLFLVNAIFSIDFLIIELIDFGKIAVEKEFESQMRFYKHLKVGIIHKTFHQ